MLAVKETLILCGLAGFFEENILIKIIEIKCAYVNKKNLCTRGKNLLAREYI